VIIQDLHLEGADFEGQSLEWTVSSLNNSSRVSSCNGHSILGGYNIGADLAKTYTSLPPHNIVYYSFSIYLIDKWDQLSDQLQIKLPGLSTTLQGFNWLPRAGYLCGNPTIKDIGEMKVTGKVLHTGSSFTIQLNDFLNDPSNIESFGIRDVLLKPGNKSQGESSEFCGSFVSSPSSSVFCDCPFGKYKNGTSCSKCHSACESCYGPTAKDCYRCKPSAFWGPNGCEICSIGCNSCSSSSTCSKCQSGFFLYDFEQKCVGSCTPPYILQGITEKLCKSPCSDHQYVLKDGTCIEECISPFTVDSVMKRYCKPPCTTPDDYYSTITGECMASCEGHESTLNGQKFCSPKADPDLPPYETNSTNPTNSTNSTNPTTPTDSTNSTNNPLENSPDKFPPLTPEQKEQIKVIADASDTGIEAIETGTIITSLARSSFGGGLNILSIAYLSKALYYTKYMNVNYHPRVIEYFEQQTDILSLSISVETPEPISQNIESRSIPSKFERYHLHSSFLINFWDTLINIVGIVVLIIVLQVCEKIIQKYKSKNWEIFIHEAKTIFKWNYLIMVFASNADDIVLFSILDLRSNKREAIWEILSFVLAITFLVALAGLLILMIGIVKKALRSPRVSDPKITQKITTTPRKFKVITQGFKDRLFFTKGFMIFFCLRAIICNAIIGLLYQYPLLQAALLTFFSLLVLTLLLFKNPFIETMDMIELACYELIVLVVNICITIVAIADYRGYHIYQVRTVTGTIMICCFLLFIFVGAIFLTIKIVSGVMFLRKIYKFMRKNGKMKISDLVRKLIQNQLFNAPPVNSTSSLPDTDVPSSLNLRSMNAITVTRSSSLEKGLISENNFVSTLNEIEATPLTKRDPYLTPDRIQRPNQDQHNVFQDNKNSKNRNPVETESNNLLIVQDYETKPINLNQEKKEDLFSHENILKRLKRKPKERQGIFKINHKD